MLNSRRSTREAAHHGIIREAPWRNSPSSPTGASANEPDFHTTPAPFPTKARETPAPATPARPVEPEPHGLVDASAGFAESRRLRKPPITQRLASAPAPSTPGSERRARGLYTHRHLLEESHESLGKPGNVHAEWAYAHHRHNADRNHADAESPVCNKGKVDLSGRPRKPLFVHLAIDLRQA